MNPKMKNGNKKKVADNHRQKPNREKSWPDLPGKLIEMISWHPILLEDISHGGVTKSWRTTSKQCHNPKFQSSSLPWIDVIMSCASFETSYPDVIGIPFHEGRWWWRYKTPWHPPWKHYVGYSNLALVAKVESLMEYFIVNPVTKSHIKLPKWDPNVPLQMIMLSSSSKDYRDGIVGSSVIMVLTGINRPAFMFYVIRGGGGDHRTRHEWIKQDCTIIDPHCPNQKSMRFTNSIGYKGKFYALSSQGTLVIIEDDVVSIPKITTLGRNRAVPSVPCKYFKEFLLQSCGEILLVFLISRKSINVVDNVEVFKLDTDELVWIKTKRLRDKTTLFLGSNNCMSVDSSQAGCKSNCVYFVHKNDQESWWEYELGSGNITLRLSNEILPQNKSYRPEFIDENLLHCWYW